MSPFSRASRSAFQATRFPAVDTLGGRGGREISALIHFQFQGFSDDERLRARAWTSQLDREKAIACATQSASASPYPAKSVQAHDCSRRQESLLSSLAVDEMIRTPRATS